MLPELAAVVGGKVIHDERNYKNLGGLPASPTPQDNERTYDAVAPKVGRLWEPQKDVQGFINVTKSLDVPDFTDLTQTQTNGSTSFVPLQAQNGWTVELGTRGRRDRFAWDITAYPAWVTISFCNSRRTLISPPPPSTPAAQFCRHRAWPQCGRAAGPSRARRQALRSPSSGTTPISGSATIRNTATTT